MSQMTGSTAIPALTPQVQGTSVLAGPITAGDTDPRQVTARNEGERNTAAAFFGIGQKVNEAA